MPEWVEREAMAGLPLVEDLPTLLPRVLTPGSMTFGHYRVSDAGFEIQFDTGAQDAAL